MNTMNELSHDTHRPIAALASGWNKSAVALIRTAGDGCFDLMAGIFSRPEKLRAADSHTLIHGHILDRKGVPLEEVVLGVFRSPVGYTGQDSVEIQTHGSPAGIRKILMRLRDAGFHDAAPGEFTLRAFLSGKMDLTEAEAVESIIEAKSLAAHGIALGQLGGALFRRIDGIKGKLLKVLAAVEVQLDYPEDELNDAPPPDFSLLREIIQDLHQLTDSYRGGKLYSQGAVVALAGKTNAGKSSLFNLFLREDRSIVSEVHGTTRDYIESWISIEGIPVRLFDTAGLRPSSDGIEAEGIRRSGELISTADLVLYLVDASGGPAGIAGGGRDPVDDIENIPELQRAREAGKLILLASKADLIGSGVLIGRADLSGKAGPGEQHGQKEDGTPEGALPVSAMTGEGFDTLQHRIVEMLTADLPSSGAADAIANDRQKHLVDQAFLGAERALDLSSAGGDGLDQLALELKSALDALGEITGEVTRADILDTIFSGFCVGK